MPMLKKPVLLFILLIPFLSCYSFISGEYAKRSLQPEYKDVKLADFDMVVHVTRDDFTIHNLRDVTGYLGIGIPLDRYWTFFDDHFPGFVEDHSSFREVQLASVDLSASLRTRTLALESDGLILVDLPKRGQAVVVGNRTPGFILFLKEFSIFRRDADAGKPFIRPKMPDEPDDMPGIRRPRTIREPQEEQDPDYGVWHTGMKFPRIINQCVYVIWDNREGRIVSYSEVSVGDGGGESSPWEPCLNSMAERIIQGSPFQE